MALSTETRPVEQSEQTTSPRRLTRSPNEKVIAGVCGGLGAYFGVDPVWFRIAFAALVLAGAGGGAILYVIAWVAMPLGDETVPPEHHGPQGVVVVGVVLIAAGLIMLSAMLIPWAGEYLWPALLIVGGLAVLGSEVRRGSRT